MSSSAGKSARSATPKPKRRKILRLLGIALVILLAGIVLVAAYLWSQRDSLIENAIREAAAERGLEVELEVLEFDRSAARIRDLIISDKSGDVLSAQSLQVTYEWRQALEGRFKRVSVIGPKITLEIDGSGRPVADWMPKQDDRSNTLGLPPDGIFVEDAQFDILSPYGRLRGTGEGTLRSKDTFEVAVDLEPTRLTLGDISGTLSGPLQFSRSGERDEFVSNSVISDWAYRDLGGDRLTLSGNGNVVITPDALDINGDFNLSSDAVDLGVVKIGNGRARYLGQAKLPRQSSARIELSGDWEGQVNQVGMPDAERRRRLAETLTLRQTLSQTPVAEHFSFGITSGIAELLERGELAGKGRVDKTQTLTDVFISNPLTWRAPKGTIELAPPSDQHFYAFDRTDETLRLSFDADFTFPRRLRMKDVVLDMDSESGRDVRAVTDFTAKITNSNTWRSRTPEGRQARLAPFTVFASYKNHERRHIQLTGAVDYDGDIPGGYATGLIADGNLFVTFDPNMRVRFASKNDRPIRIDRFDTVTDWYAENVAFILPPNTAFFTRTGPGRGNLATRLNDVNASLSRLDGSQSMVLDIASSDVKAQIRPNRQDWVVENGSVRMASDNIPSPGTVMTSDVSRLEATLIPDQPVQFTLSSPEADVRTQLVTANGLSVTASGTPDRVDVDYENASVTFLAAELPTVPMTGNVIYENLMWVGDAVTSLPGAENTPIDVAYQFNEGIGTARVEITDLEFTPRGL